MDDGGAERTGDAEDDGEDEDEEGTAARQQAKEETKQAAPTGKKGKKNRGDSEEE